MDCPNCKKVRCANGSLSVSVEGCDCPLTVRVLWHLGAKRAAQMHARDLSEDPPECTGEEWIVHMDEEEEFFLPFVRLVEKIQPDMSGSATTILADHIVFRREIAEHGKIQSLERVKWHAALEDKIAAILISKGIG